MKHVLKSSLALMFLLVLGIQVNGQEKTKKVKSFHVERTLPFPALRVWTAVGEDYGNIANAHPKIWASDYLNGSLAGGEGVQRVCYFNEKGSRLLHEQIKDWNPAEMSFTNTVFEVGGFPLNGDYTEATYKVAPVDDKSSILSFDMKYRAKPAFMGGMMKGQFKKLISQYMVAIQHHLSTGEVVNAKTDNYKKISKLYTNK